jgi:hypothetical protein
MRDKVCRRLERLEEIKAASDRAKAAAATPRGPSVAERIREHLRRKGFVQTGNESLADTLARALGMTSRELHHLTTGPAEAFNAKLLSLQSSTR